MQGWYADPYGQAPLRWWDGYAWTTYTMTAPPPRDPRVDVAKERRWAPWAKRGIVLLPLAYLLTALTELMLSVPASRSLDAVLDGAVPSVMPDGSISPPQQVALGLYDVASFVAFLVLLAALVPLVIWFYKMVIAAKTLRLNPPRPTSWAVLGWIVPIVELWFPYQFARNASSPNSPLRQQLKGWWASHVAIKVIAIASIPLGLWSHGAAAALSFVLVIPAVIFAVLTFRIIDKFGDEHEQLLAADLDPQLVPVG